MRQLRLFLLCTLGCLTACGSHRDDEDVEATTEPLTNNYTFSGCTAAQRSLLQSATSLINSNLGTVAYRSCVRAAVMTEMHGVLVEDIIERLQAKSTTIQCTAAGSCGGSAVACATVGDLDNGTPEVMSIEADYLVIATAAQVARTLVHEATHTSGFNHPGSSSDMEYPCTVPVQFGTCIDDYTPDGWPRDETHGDTLLAAVGGDGGQPFELRCPGDQFVRGITVDSSTYTEGFRLHCDQDDTGYTGESAGATQQKVFDCDPGDYLVRVSGSSDSIVRSLRGFCASGQDLAAEVASPAMYNSGLGGSLVGTSWNRPCPNGMAIKGAIGRSGARIDQLQWICEDYDGNHPERPVSWGTAGTAKGNAKLGYCLGHGVMMGIYGKSGALVDALGGGCYPTTVDAAGRLDVLEGNGNRHAFDYNGGIGGVNFDQRCAAGQVMVGVRVRETTILEAVGALCATPSSWASWPSSYNELPLKGGSTGTVDRLVCPANQYLVGLKTWADTNTNGVKTVQAAQIRCRPLD